MLGYCVPPSEMCELADPGAHKIDSATVRRRHIRRGPTARLFAADGHAAVWRALPGQMALGLMAGSVAGVLGYRMPPSQMSGLADPGAHKIDSATGAAVGGGATE